jgi:hypothetical protein
MVCTGPRIFLHGLLVKPGMFDPRVHQVSLYHRRNQRSTSTDAPTTTAAIQRRRPSKSSPKVNSPAVSLKSTHAPDFLRPPASCHSAAAATESVTLSHSHIESWSLSCVRMIKLFFVLKSEAVHAAAAIIYENMPAGTAPTYIYVTRVTSILLLLCRSVPFQASYTYLTF